MSGISRRPFLTSALALIGVAAAGGGAYELGLFRKHFSKYGNLLDALDDPDNAQRIGKAVLAATPHGFVRDFNAVNLAEELRARIGTKSLTDVLIADAQANRVTEAGGWVMPETLAMLCVLATAES